MQRALRTLRELGLVIWTQRLVRDGWRAAQTSNAYALTLGDPPQIPSQSCGGQKATGTIKQESYESFAAQLEAEGRANAIRQLITLGVPIPEKWQ